MTITLEAYGLIIGIFWGLFGVIGICGYREPRQELAQQRIISKFIIEDKCLNGTLSGFGISFPLLCWVYKVMIGNEELKDDRKDK